ncbi:MAG: inositol-3-phosphate synthase [Thermoprotei archaeon]
MRETDSCCKNEIRVAVAGVGSAVSGMLQAVELYSKGEAQGLLHPALSVYTPSNIRVVAAFDVDKAKIGKSVGEALFVHPWSLGKYVDVHCDTVVQPGLLLDEAPFEVDTHSSGFDSVVETLKASGAQVLVNTINSGLNRSTEAYARAAIKAGLAFVNATPTPIATNTEIEREFASAGLPLLGDDLLSQVGGTIFHTYILSFLNSRGVKIKQTYQIDVGGGLENRITVEQDELRLHKRSIKTSTVTSTLPYPVKAVTGTTEYVDYMGNNRESHFEIVGSTTLGAEVEVEITLRTSDGANAAGPLIDAVRAAKVALDKRVRGAVEEVNPYIFKLVRSPVDPISAQTNFLKFFD